MYFGLVVASGYFQNSVFENYPTSQPSDGQQEKNMEEHKLSITAIIELSSCDFSNVRNDIHKFSHK